MYHDACVTAGIVIYLARCVICCPSLRYISESSEKTRRAEIKNEPLSRLASMYSTYLALNGGRVSLSVSQVPLSYRSSW